MPEGQTTPELERVPALPEQGTEAPDTGASFESPAAVPERPVEPATPAAAIPSSIAQAPHAQKDPTILAVEAVLEEDLGETYKHLTPPLQAKFKSEGERVSGLIADMVRTAKVNARIVLKLIIGWLKIIPGVNRFFLAQEAKIKTDRILKL